MEEMEVLAQQGDGASHKKLQSMLADVEMLHLLDSEDYNGPVKQMRIATILYSLMENTAKPSDLTLESLTQVPVFKSDDNYLELLIQALAYVRPATPRMIAYWQPHVRPDALFKHYAVEALCINGSQPAIGLLEKCLLDPSQDPEDILIWMHDPILRHRNDVPLLQMALRLIESDFPENYKIKLLEGLYLYDSDTWYQACTKPEPPESLSNEAKQLRRQILDIGLKTVAVPSDQRPLLEANLESLGGRHKD